jgi:hypothetical protein
MVGTLRKHKDGTFRNFEIVNADYLELGKLEQGSNKRNLLRRPVTLYRFDKLVSGQNARFYFRIGRKKIYSYISLTSLINHVLPKGFGYEMWLKSLGEKAEIVKMDRAVFGTALHEQAFKPLIEDGTYSFDWLAEKDRNGWTNYSKLHPKEYWEKSRNWYYSFTRSMMSFFQFCTDRVEQVLAVEIPLRSDRFKYAGTLDLVCLLRFNGKIVLAIIDMKSFYFTIHTEKKEKTFYDTHELQLELQKNLWLENFGVPFYNGKELPIMLFNFSPNNWRKEPTYTLKNQTKNRFTEMMKVTSRVRIPVWQNYARMGMQDNIHVPKTNVVDIYGEVENVFDFKWQNHIQTVEV